MTDIASTPESFPRPKRSWRRFTLRALFLVVLALGIFFGWVAHQVRELQIQAALVARLRAKGFKVYVDPPKFAWFWRSLGGESVGTLTRAALLAGDEFGNWFGPTNEELYKIADCQSVTALTVYGPGATDETIDAICKLPQLEYLRLINPNITEAVIYRARRRLGTEFKLDTPLVIRNAVGSDAVRGKVSVEEITQGAPSHN